MFLRKLLVLLVFTLMTEVEIRGDALERIVNMEPYREPRIVHGIEADAFDTRYQVSIRLRLNEGYFFGTGHECGGSLISSNVVLSAAHCFIEYNNSNDNTDKKLIIFDFSQIQYDGTFMPVETFVVVMGNLNRFQQDNNTMIFDIKKFIKYREIFNVSTFEHDLILLVLNATVPKNHPTIAPITLNDGKIKIGDLCSVAGWGQTENGTLADRLMIVDVPLYEAGLCRIISDYGPRILDGMLCAGYLQGKFDACRGDSGGALVCKGRQTGIVSWGTDCAQRYLPGVFTNVAIYKNWILKQMRVHNVSLARFSGNRSNELKPNLTLVIAIFISILLK